MIDVPLPNSLFKHFPIICIHSFIIEIFPVTYGCTENTALHLMSLKLWWYSIFERKAHFICTVHVHYILPGGPGGGPTAPGGGGPGGRTTPPAAHREAQYWLKMACYGDGKAVHIIIIDARLLPGGPGGPGGRTAPPNIHIKINMYCIQQHQPIVYKQHQFTPIS